MLKNLARRFSRSSLLLGRVPSLMYGLMYLLLIPVFALVYSSLTDQFYHSTVQYERSLKAEAADIQTRLERDLKAAFVRVHGAGKVPYKGNRALEASDMFFVGWTLDADSLRIDSFGVEGTTASFRVPATLTHEDARYGMKSSVEMSPYPKFLFGIADPNHIRYPKAPGVVCVNVALSGESRESLSGFMKNVPKYLFPEDCGVGLGDGLILMSVSSDVMDAVSRYANGMRGFPGKVRGHYMRMLYFSATVITTLGFGDILPLTDLARFLVVLEAVSGVVIIGLFLNSLSYQRKENHVC